MCVCVSMGMHVCDMVLCVWRSEDNFEVRYFPSTFRWVLRVVSTFTQWATSPAQDFSFFFYTQDIIYIV